VDDDWLVLLICAIMKVYNSIQCADMCVCGVVWAEGRGDRVAGQ
jgi:hypothetical protein